MYVKNTQPMVPAAANFLQVRPEATSKCKLQTRTRARDAFYLFISRLRQPLREVPRGFEYRRPDGNRRRDIAYCLLEPLGDAQRLSSSGHTERKSHGATRRETVRGGRDFSCSFYGRVYTMLRARFPLREEPRVEIYPLSRQQLVEIFLNK